MHIILEVSHVEKNLITQLKSVTISVTISIECTEIVGNTYNPVAKKQLFLIHKLE